MATSVKTPVDLAECVCEPMAEWRDGYWCVRCSMAAPDGAILPLFVYVRKTRHGIGATLESDQTDYGQSNPGDFRIRRCGMKQLHFWK